MEKRSRNTLIIIIIIISSRSSHNSGLEIGASIAALPGAWRCRANAGTDWWAVARYTLQTTTNLMYSLGLLCPL